MMSAYRPAPQPPKRPRTTACADIGRDECRGQKPSRTRIEKPAGVFSRGEHRCLRVVDLATPAGFETGPEDRTKSKRCADLQNDLRALRRDDGVAREPLRTSGIGRNRFKMGPQWARESRDSFKPALPWSVMIGRDVVEHQERRRSLPSLLGARCPSSVAFTGGNNRRSERWPPISMPPFAPPTSASSPTSWSPAGPAGSGEEQGRALTEHPITGQIGPSNYLSAVESLRSCGPYDVATFPNVDSFTVDYYDHATGQLKAAYLFGGGNNYIFCLAGPPDGLPSISCPDGTGLPLDCSAAGGVDAGGSDGSGPD